MENVTLDRNSSEADLGRLQRMVHELQTWLPELGFQFGRYMAFDNYPYRK